MAEAARKYIHQQECLAPPPNNDAAPRALVVAGAQFPPALAGLVKTWLGDGGVVDVFYTGGQGTSGRVLRHDGRRVARDSKNRLCGAARRAHLLLACDAFAFGGSGARSWHLRRVEEIRTLASLWSMLMVSDRVTLTLAPRDLVTRCGWCVLLLVLAALVSGGAQGTLGWARAKSAQTNKDILALRDANPSLFPVDQTTRLTPGTLDSAVRRQQEKGQLSTRHVQELRMIAAAARLATQSDPLAAAMLRAMQNAAPSGDVPEGWTNCDTAVARKFGVPITAYMLHLHTVLRLQDRFALTTPDKLRAFAQWYACEAHRHVLGNWVPIHASLRDYLLHDGQVASDKPVDDAIMLLPTTAKQLARILCRLMHTRCDFDLSHAVGAGLATYLQSPVIAAQDAPTRLELLIALMIRGAVNDNQTDMPPWQTGEAREIARKAASVVPWLDAPRGLRQPHAPRALVCGYKGAQTGIGANMDMTSRVLSSLNLDHQSVSYKNNSVGDEVGGGRPRRSFAIHHVNADRIPQSVIGPHNLSGRPAFNIGYLLWEFDKLPHEHALALDVLDEIWVPSAFLRDVYQAATDKTVECVGKCIDASIWDAHLPLDIADDARFTFLVAFDFHSSVARKNPLAAVNAFLDAFPPARQDVRLIIKSTPIARDHWGDPEGQIDAIRRIAARDPRIDLIEQFIPKAEFLGLIAAADCLISAHRAEGFGLIPAWAMAMGTSVIATDYSGTSDFCSDRTAFPVPCDMVSVDASHMIYPAPGAHWAEIDHDALVNVMRCVPDHQAMARRRALLGKRLMQGEYSQDACGARYKARLDDLGLI